MARDPQAALVALNRFGFGARGGSSGIRQRRVGSARFRQGRVERPNGVLLEAPGLQSTSALAQGLFAYQFDIKQRREAATKAGTPMPAEAKPLVPAAEPVKSPTRNLSLNTARADMTVASAMNEGSGGPGMTSPVEPPNAPKPPPQPLNIIQKTFRAEALARLQRATIADCGFAERLVVFWSNHFCISANKGEPARMWPARSSVRRSVRMCSGDSRTC